MCLKSILDRILTCSSEHPSISRIAFLNLEIYVLRGSSFPWQIVLRYVFPFLVIFAMANLSKSCFESYLNEEIELSSNFLYHAWADPVRDNGNPLQSRA